MRQAKPRLSYELDRPVLIHVCKDGTISYRTREEPVFNGRALPVFSVDTEEQARAVQVRFGRRQYGEHPDLPGRPWYRWTDFDGRTESLDLVSRAIYEFFHRQVQNPAGRLRSTPRSLVRARLLEERRTQRSKIEAAYVEAARVVATGRCPTCGSGLRQNNAIHGWWQCEQFGAEQFRARPQEPSCSFQTFTK